MKTDTCEKATNNVILPGKCLTICESYVKCRDRKLWIVYFVYTKLHWPLGSTKLPLKSRHPINQVASCSSESKDVNTELKVT